MQEIKCPNCGEVFAVDESGYAQIAKQVRDTEFEKELKRREDDFAQMKENALKLAQMEQKEEFAKELSVKEAQLLEKEKVAVVPGTAFGESGEGFLRISYAYSLEDLKAALGRIENFVRTLKREQ